MFASSPFPRRLGLWLALLAAVIALALSLSAAVELFVDHDEHQFIVPGLLTTEQGLLPYRDYPLFHVPYLILLHGALGTLTGWPLLSARLLTAFAGWLILVVLGLYTWRRLPEDRWRVPMTIALPALLLFQPIFPETVAYVWNHCTPVLFVLLAAILHLRAPHSLRPGWILALSGALLALAVGMRLTFLPLFAPFGLYILFLPQRSWPARLRLAAAFSGAAVLVALPVAFLWMQAPEPFLFGNLGYPKLSTLWRRYPVWHPEIARFVDPVLGFLDPLHEGMKGRDLATKLRQAVAVTGKQNWPLLAAFLLLSGGAVVAAIRTKTVPRSLLFVGALLPFVFWGCVAPSRFHPQYFFAFMPSLLLVCAESAAFLQHLPRLAKVFSPITVLLALISLLLGLKQYRFARDLSHFEKWGPVKTHRAGQAAVALAGSGKILTLDPVLVAEADGSIYREFSSGEFGWRTAHLLPLSKRQLFHLITLADLDRFLAADPPSSVLLDRGEKRQNPPLLKWAEAHGYELIGSYGLYGLWKKPGSR